MEEEIRFLTPDDKEFAKIRNQREFQKEKATTSYIAGHLSSPTNNEEVNFLLNPKHRFYCPRHKNLDLILKLTENKINTVEDIQSPFSLVHEIISQNIYDLGNHKKVDIKDLLNTSFITTFYNEVSHMRPAIEGELITAEDIKRDLDEKLSEIEFDDNLFLSYKEMKKAEFIKDKICCKEINLGSLLTFRNMRVEKEISILNHKGSNYVIPTNLLLGVLDRMQARFMLLLYWKIKDTYHEYGDESLYKTGMKLIQLFENLRSSMGQDFYDIMKGWEPLIKGFVIGKEDDVGFTSLFETQYKDIAKVLLDNGLDAELITQMLPHNNLDLTCKMYLELIGMNKIFGNPILNIHELLDPSRKHGEDHPEINENIFKDIMGVVKRNFMEGYYDKNGIYPNIHSAPPLIMTFVNKNKKISQGIRYNYALFNEVEFTKTLSYDFTPDTFELIKDSAIAAPMKYWSYQFDECAYRNHYNKSPPRQNPQGFIPRTIDQFLQDEPDKVKKLIIDRDNGVDYSDDKIAVQCPKENELTTGSGRAFTKQTYNQRLIQTSMEMNIADSILRYVPNQTMTDTEITETLRTLNQVEAMSKKGCYTINIDFKKWNLKFRHALVYNIGVVADQLFGFKTLYSNQHLWFVNVNMFNNSRLCPPDYDAQGQPIPGAFYSDRHIGGLEGLNQKKWTWLTTAILDYCYELCGVSATTMIQGDNISICVNFSVEQQDNKKEIVTNLLNKMSEVFESLGHELKIEETWISKNLQEYGKVLYYKGSAVSSGTKKATKIIPDINDGLFAYESSISTINTITESIAKQDVSPLPSFIINQFAILNFLIRKELVVKSNQNKLLMCLLFPLDFGGIPLTTISSHTVRGHNDKITEWLEIYHAIKKCNMGLFKKLMEILQLGPKKQPTSYKQRTRLYEDIYALNIDSMPSINNMLKDYALEFLQSDYVKNKSIRDLYESDAAVAEDTIIRNLDSMDPLFPSMASEVLLNSNAGILKKLRVKLTRVGTISKIIQNAEKRSYISLMNENNQDYKEELNRRLRRRCQNINLRKLIEENDCMTRVAILLREFNWNKKFVNLTKPCWGSQVVITRWDQTPDIKRSISIKTDEAVFNYPSMINQLGLHRCYVGSSTREKIEKPLIDISQKVSQYASLMRLGIIRSYTERLYQVNWISLLNQLLKEKIHFTDDIQFEDIDLALPHVKGGNPLHRLISAMEKRYALVNLLITPNSHIQIDTNYLAALTLHGKDFSVFYQLLFLAAASIVVELSRLKKADTTHFACILRDCAYCVEEMNIEGIDLKNLHDIPKADYSSLNQDIIEFKVQFDKEQIVTAYTLHNALLIGSITDDNYEMIYNSKYMNVKLSKLMTTDSISMNDVRCMNLKMLVTISLMSSSHTRTILMEYNPVRNMLSSDYSYKDLASTIMKSGRIKEFFDLYPHNIHNHNTCVNHESLSQHIAKNVKGIIKRHLVEIIHVLSNDNIDKSLLQRLNILSVYNLLYDENLKNYRDLKKKLRVKMTTKNRYNLDFSKTTMLWRNMDRSDLIKKTNTVSFTKLKVSRGIEFNDTIHVNFSAALINCNVSNVKDNNFHHVLRGTGIISSAPTKYLEILSHCDYLRFFMMEDKPNIHGYAEGSGAVITSLLCLNPSSICHYNTLLENSVDLRDSTIYNYPPAVMSTNYYNEKTFPTLNSLASGDTDILKESTKMKIIKALIEYPPSIITMDAESPNHGSNFEFVEFLCTTFINSNAKVIIFKMFLYEGLINKVSDYLYAERLLQFYNFTFIKPLSSNPLSKEIFLVLIHKSHKTTKSEFFLKLNTLNMYNIPINPVMSFELLRNYFSLSKEHLMCQKSIWDLDKRLELVSPFKQIFDDLNICGPRCPPLIMEYLALFCEIHFMDVHLYKYLDIFRKSGVNQKLEDVLYSMIFSIVAYKERDLFKTYNAINMIRIDDIKEWRAQINRLISENKMKDNFEIKGLKPLLRMQVHTPTIDLYYNAKYMLLELSKQNVFKSKCDCTIKKQISLLQFSVFKIILNDLIGCHVLTEQDRMEWYNVLKPLIK